MVCYFRYNLLLLLAFFVKQPKLVAISSTIAFANPNAPVYPRLAQGKMWNDVSLPFVLALVSKASIEYIAQVQLQQIPTKWKKDIRVSDI